MSRPGALAALLALAALSAVGVRPAHAAGPCDPPITNPIPCENSKSGAPPSQWDISGSGDPSIQGFATDISVNRGGTISFKVSTTASSYSLTIYRLGYYQGNGARQIATVAPSAPLPQKQPNCLSDSATGLVDCGNWAVSASWQVPSDAVSGVYFARLFRPDTGGASHIHFDVRDDSGTSDLLFQTSDTTWQAYNQYGGNSLYLGTAPNSSDGRAYKVSYNRPFATRGQGSGYGTSNFVFYGEYPMIRFLESNGYNVSYSSEVDTDRRGSLLLNHRVFLSTGHDEYWSAGQRASVEAARAAGVSLAFFSGNEMFWKVRWENSIDGSGTPYRTLVCYKETIPEARIDPQDPPTWTGTWRDPTWSPPADGGRPENAVTGTIFTVNRGSAAIQVPSTFSGLRFWRNTAVASLAPGQTTTLGPQTLGYEWDEDLDNGFRPPGTMKMSLTTVANTDHLVDNGNTYLSQTATHSLTLHRSSGGGLVFAAGTVQWSWGLDVNHDTVPDSGPTSPDPNMRQATVNLLADMGAQPGTPQAGLVPATASTDTVAPTSAITAPSAGATVGSGATVTISGTAADSGGGVVAGVEVSFDGGATWHTATGTTSWTYSWHTGRPGSATLRSRAVDDSGNLEAPSAGFAVTIGGSTSPAFVSRSTVMNGTSVAAPAGVFPGDLLLASLEVDADPVTVTGPSGWKLLMDTPAARGTGSAFHAQVWYKVATASEPATYSWGVPGNVYTDIGVLDYMNIGGTSPVDASAGRDAGTTASPTTPSVTTTAPGDMLVAFFIDYQLGAWTAGSGMTQRYGFDSTTAQDALQAAAGSTGTKTATNTVSGAMSAQIVALRPVQTDTQPPVVSVTAPAGGSTVSGNAVTLSASASDNVGVSSVQFLVDGSPVGSPLTATPYSTTWDSGTVANGSHTIAAKASDAAGNTTTSSPVTVTVSNVVPVISGVGSGSVTSSGATITWSTDTLADSQVDYGTTTAYGSSTTLDPTLVTSHSQVLSGLSPATLYHYRVKSRSSSGGLAVSGDFTLTTGTPPPPVISGVGAGSITSSGATVTWSTDTPADSQVDYGLTTAYSSSTVLNSTLVTSHSQALSGLSAATTYHYRARSRDAYGQLTLSGDFTFTTITATTPPAFRSRSTVTNGTTVARPTGAAAGDLLLANLEVDADPATVTGPAGWTKVLDTVAAAGTSSVFHAQVWYRIATASEPSSYAWTVSGGPWVDIGILDYSGVNQASPIDASAGTYSGVTASPSTPAVTATAGNDMVVALFMGFDFGTWTAGSGMTQRYDFDSVTAQDAVQASAGSTGARTGSHTASTPTTAQIVALRAP